jgi:hypothetical protein
MAENLNYLEPGFFSEVRENPNLALVPNTLDIVAIIGTGKATTPIYENLAGLTGGTGMQQLSSGVQEFLGFNGTFSSGVSNFGFSVVGGATGSFTFGSTGETLSINVGETVYSIGLTGTSLSPADVAVQINASAGASGNFTAAAYGGASGSVQIITLNGQEIQIGSTGATANSILGFTGGDWGNNIYWHANGPTTPYTVGYESPGSSFTPKYFYSLQSVIDQYGEPSTSATISMGAQAAFTEGAQVVLCRLLNPEAGDLMTEYQAALDDLKKFNCNIVVPMLPINTYPQVGVKTMAHCSDMSNKINRKERVCILGADETETIMPLTGAGSWQELTSGYVNLNPVTGLKSNRVVIMAPGSAYVSLPSGLTFVNGTVLAAALAGRILNTSYDEATPMTRKPLVSIAGLYERLSDEKTRVEKNALSTQYGCTVVEMNSSVAVIRRAVTSNISSIASQELSIVRSFDRIASELRALLEAQFIGIKISPNTPGDVANATSSYLNRMVNEAIIGSFRGVSVVPHVGEPRQMDVSFEAVPIYPFLWGFVDISITLG